MTAREPWADRFRGEPLNRERTKHALTSEGWAAVDRVLPDGDTAFAWAVSGGVEVEVRRDGEVLGVVRFEAGK